MHKEARRIIRFTHRKWSIVKGHYPVMMEQTEREIWRVKETGFMKLKNLERLS